ncbi:MAG: MFS transporter [Candidatus Hodarchaeota archaeon]
MDNKDVEILHSKKSMASYGFGKFVNEFLNMAFGAFVFFYYEAEIGLSVWLTAFGYIIFAIWNAVNDPFIGYLVDRPFNFTKKWGRRFPWVFIGGVPWIICYLLLFTPPAVDPKGEGAWLIFLWLLIMTCLYDTFYSIFNVNFYGLFPDKFRSENERRDAAGISTMVGTFGVALGAIIPPLFIVFGNKQSYIIQAGVAIIVCIIALALTIPGCREDQERIDCYLEKCEEGLERGSFFRTFRTSLKHKNFIAYTLAFLFYYSLVLCMIGSIPYMARYRLERKAGDIILIMAGLLIGSFCSIPLWTIIARKIKDDRKTIIIAAIAMIIFTGLLIFINDYYILFIGMLIWGTSLGGFWVMLSPNFANVIDESVILTSKREEGLYNGINTFVARASLIIQAVSFAVVHTLTGFSEGAATQSAEAKWGIQIHFALLPMIFIIITAVIFIKFFDLTPEKVKSNKEKLVDIGI